MTRTLSLITALALSLYGTLAFPQATAPTQASAPPHATSAAPAAAAPSTAQPEQNAGGTTDEELTKAIHSALDADPHHFFRHVNVRVDNGVATLSGFVNSSQAINRARTIAANVPGVTRVVSGNLTLEPNRPR